MVGDGSEGTATDGVLNSVSVVGDGSEGVASGGAFNTLSVVGDNADGAVSGGFFKSVTVDVPVTVDDSYTVVENTTLSTDVANGVLANDTDPGERTLTVEAVTQPVNGAVMVNLDGSFQYVPDAGYVGTDSFSYTVSNGAHSSTATVTITVTADVPVAVDDIYTTD